MIGIDDFVRSVWKLEDPDMRAEVGGCLQVVHFRKGELVIRHGDICRGFFFMASEGLLKCVFYTPAGKEITECFINRVGQPAVPDANMGGPSRYEMQALTDADLFYLPHQALMELVQKQPILLQIMVLNLQAAVNYHIELKTIHYMGAEERYDWFVLHYPDVLGNAKLKDIASFLDITPVTLSRIRRKKKENASGN